MIWNEQDHPRDEDGKFTFKDGGSSANSENDTSSEAPFKLKTKVNVFNKNKTHADILYKDSKAKAEIEKIKSQYRNVLLETLGKLATPAVVFYYGINKLEKMVKENGLTDKLTKKVEQSKILQGITEKMIGENFNRAKYNLSKLSGADVQGTLDIAHGEENMHGPNYIKDTIKLKNYDDPAINSYKKTIKQKVLKEFKDYGYNENTIGNIKGYYFKDNSEPSQRILNSDDFKKIIKDNKEKILSNKEFPIDFPAHGPRIAWGSNLKNAIGKAQLLDYYIDKQGNLYVKILDTYDFNKDAKDFLNKAGRRQMLKGNLKPYFTVYEVKISKQELDEIWNN